MLANNIWGNICEMGVALFFFFFFTETHHLNTSNEMHFIAFCAIKLFTLKVKTSF